MSAGLRPIFSRHMAEFADFEDECRRNRRARPVTAPSTNAPPPAPPALINRRGTYRSDKILPPAANVARPDAL